MKPAIYLSLFFLTHSLTASIRVLDKAVVIVPVVDCTGAVLTDEIPRKELENFYRSFPSAPDKGYFGCLRIHQLKFNEIVKVLSIEGPVAECEVSNLYYLDTYHKKRKNFWLLKKYLRSLPDLEKKMNTVFIPRPIDMQKACDEYNKNTLTLMGPWFDGKRWYSAGTRFARCPQKDSDNSYALHLNDYLRCTTALLTCQNV